jgi:hypothetical protein
MSNMFSKHDELSSAASISAVADFALVGGAWFPSLNRALFV